MSGLYRAKLAHIADDLLVAVAVSLPWSTSLTGILLVLWLLALIPTLDWFDVRRELMTPAGGLPFLLFLLGVVGMTWADATVVERWNGLSSFFKLLAVPLLIVQLRESGRGLWIFGGYFSACAMMLVLSTLIDVAPSLWWQRFDNGVPVKNAATQSGEFATCIAVLLYLVLDLIKRNHYILGLGGLLLALFFLANIFYVATGRTALVILLVLMALFAIKNLSAKGMFILTLCTIVAGGLGWMSSPYLRTRTTAIWTDLKKYEATNQENSSSERIEYWLKSLRFINESPIIGHGTGSIHSLYQRSALGQVGAAGSATTNPHNQTFAVAIQLGIVGAILLWMMWVIHLSLFRGSSLVEWIGLVVVTQNIVGSLFNSHLFDFTQGWTYVLGVGVAGGMVLKMPAAKRSNDAAA